MAKSTSLILTMLSFHLIVLIKRTVINYVKNALYISDQHGVVDHVPHVFVQIRETLQLFFVLRLIRHSIELVGHLLIRNLLRILVPPRKYKKHMFCI